MTRASDLFGEAPFGPNPLFRQGLPGQGTYVRFTTRGQDGLWLHVGYVGARLAADNSPEIVAWVFDPETEMAHHITFGTSGLTVWEPGFQDWGDTPAVHLGSDGVLMALSGIILPRFYAATRHTRKVTDW